MKKGRVLQEQPGVLHRRVREFKLIPNSLDPHGKTSKYLIDGDVFPASPVHVKVLHKMLTVMTRDPGHTGSDHSHAHNKYHELSRTLSERLPREINRDRAQRLATPPALLEVPGPADGRGDSMLNGNPAVGAEAAGHQSTFV